MIEVVQKRSIIFLWFWWYFYEMSVNLLGAWRNFLLFNLNYFSIPLLLKTFLSPWRRYKWSYPRGFSPWGYFETFISNSISRILGAICRIVLIIAGILVQIFILILGAIIFLGWLTLPLFLFLGIVYGFRFLF